MTAIINATLVMEHYYIPEGYLVIQDGKIIEGFSADDCLAFSGDSTCAMLTWQGGKDVSFLKDTTFRIRFVMENGEFYAFWLSETEDGDSNGYYGGGLFQPTA